MLPVFSAEYPALDGIRYSHRRTFKTCLIAQDEVALSRRLTEKIASIRFVKRNDVTKTWKFDAPYPPFPIYRALQDVPGTIIDIDMLLLADDWRPNWVKYEGSAGWRIENLPFPRVLFSRSYIARLTVEAHPVRWDLRAYDADYVKSVPFKIRWDPDDLESKRMASSILSVVASVTTQKVQTAALRRPLEWVETRDRVRYGKHALIWAVAGPRRFLECYYRHAALPLGADPKALGFRDE